MDPKIAKKTQDMLGKIIKKPPLTEKLLSKPPFRFLHDIMTSVVRTTGFMKGLFTEAEMNSDNVKDKDSKIAFLQKAVDMIVTGQRLSVKPIKVVAGHEPENTNEFLQALAVAINAKVDNEEYVKRVLSGGGGSSKGEKEHDRGDTERTRSAGRKRDSRDKQRKEDEERNQDRPKDRDRSRGDRHKEREGNEKERDQNRTRDQREKSQEREEKHRDKERDHEKDPEKDRDRRRRLEGDADSQDAGETGSETHPHQQEGKTASHNEAHGAPSAQVGSSHSSFSSRQKAQSLHESGNKLSPRHAENSQKNDNAENSSRKHRYGGLREGRKASKDAASGNVQSQHGSQKPNYSGSGTNTNDTKQGAARSRQIPSKKSLKPSASVAAPGQDAEAAHSKNSGKSTYKNSVTLEGSNVASDSVKPSGLLKGNSKKREQKSGPRVPRKFSPPDKPKDVSAESAEETKPSKEQAPYRRSAQGSQSNINLQKDEQNSQEGHCITVDSNPTAKAREMEEKENETPETNAEKESNQDTSVRLQRPASAKGSRRRRQGRDNKDEEDEEFQQRFPDDNQESGLGDEDLPPQVVAARKIGRPSSARPAPPRPKHEGSEAEPTMRLGSGAPTNLITDNDRQSEDEDENFLVEETAPPPPPSITDQASSQAVPEDDAEHGALVKKMLESKKEAEQQQQPSLIRKTEIERPALSDVQRRKQREMVSKEIERLQGSIQSLTRSANPLGKIMDYVQEDLDSMQKELDRWWAENKEHALALRRERSVTDRAVEPLRAQLADLERAISDQLDLIAATKSNILRNDQRIDKILHSLAKS